MVAAVARRLAAGLAVVAGVATLTFFLVRLAPGDPVERLLGPAATAEQLAAQRQALGLDQSLPAQYAAWLARMARGEWGRSIASGRPVRAVLAEAWPATAALVGLSLLLSYLLGIAVGAVQAARGGTRLASGCTTCSVTPCSPWSRCWGSRSRRCLRVPCSWRLCSPGPASDGSWSRPSRLGTTRS